MTGGRGLHLWNHGRKDRFGSVPLVYAKLKSRFLRAMPLWLPLAAYVAALAFLLAIALGMFLADERPAIRAGCFGARLSIPLVQHDPYPFAGGPASLTPTAGHIGGHRRAPDPAVNRPTTFQISTVSTTEV